MMGLACSWGRETRTAYQILVGKFLRKYPLKDRRRYEDNIKIYLRETDCEDGRCMELAEDRAQSYHSINY
jgi:hypothetical protein